MQRKAPIDRDALKPKVNVLSTEKSKKGLAEEYEDEYKKQALNLQVDDSTGNVRAEVQELFDRLCHQLDALSNFHYSPKRPKAADVTVKPAVAALAMEEALPVAKSLVSTVAPGEVKAPQQGRDIAVSCLVAVPASP